MRIFIIGSGNVGSHLLKAMSPLAPVAISAHHLSHRQQATWIQTASSNDIAIISVPDSYLAEVAGELKKFPGIVAHTSGGVDLQRLQELLGRKEKTGVFYPLQTFTKDVDMDYSGIPMLIEGDSESTEESLRDLASVFSSNVRNASSSDRLNLHIAAVFACNFTNHLWALADNYLKRQGLEFGLLIPLLQQSVAKLLTLSPAEAQTGPAVRNDTETMQRHLTTLYGKNDDLHLLYTLLSQSIITSTRQNVEN